MISLLFSRISQNISSNITDEEAVKEYLKTQKTYYFDLLYQRYSGKIFGKCISLLKDEEHAEDATQEIFVKILLNLAKFSGKSKFSTWVYSITYNFCIDMIRRKKKDKSIYVDDLTNKHDVADDEISDKFLLEINIKRLEIILDKIPVTDKSILLMKYQDSMSIKNISEIMTKSESAIKMKIKRAKQKFKKIHNEHYID